MQKVVLTYGTFDLFHVGHVRILQRAKSLGDRLVVGVSTDEFNAVKGKRTIISFKDRVEIVRSMSCVDEAFLESSWDQKRSDIEKYHADILVMGSDWEGKFDDLKDICEVVYLSRTDGISSSSLRSILRQTDNSRIQQMREALEIISAAIQPFQE